MTAKATRERLLGRRPLLKAAGGGLLFSPLFSGTSMADEGARQQVWADNFVAHPWGAEVVQEDDRIEPVSDPTVQGLATFQYSDYDQRVWYRIYLGNTEGVTAVTLNQGDVGENGSPIVELHSSEPTGRIHGEFIRGELQPAQTAFFDEGSLTDLVDTMREDTCYLQIETENGALRGQTRRDMFDLFRHSV